MADTRCANPEYQLDVDLMILEYLLYQATKAQLNILTEAEDTSFSGQEGGDGNETEPKVEADKLLVMFDSFIQLFKQNHPLDDLSPGTNFNIKILEFLVLLERRRSYESSTTGLAELPKLAARKGIEAELQEILLSRSEYALQRKEHWKAVSQTQQINLPRGATVLETESKIFRTWAKYQYHYQLPKASPKSTLNPIPLIVLLSRFMELSAEMSGVMGKANEKWMTLAGEFMLQAGIEGLARTSLPRSATSSKFEQALSQFEFPLDSILSVCFAWGFVADESVFEVEDIRKLISDMFRDSEMESGKDRHGRTRHRDVSPPAESTLWRDLRHQYLTEFHLSVTEFHVCDSLEDYAELHLRRLGRLSSKYPYQAFEKNLVHYISGLQQLNNSSDVTGKPVLVQIEEGSLDILGNDDDGTGFEEFMKRVGIQNLDFKGVFGV